MRLLSFSSLALLAAFSSPVAAMDFVYRDVDASGGVLVGSGEINRGDDLKLHNYVASLPASTHIKGISLESPGGNYVEGVNLATTIQASHLQTGVVGDGTCASACFILFASGSYKFVGAGARIGVHSASEEGEDTGLAQAVTTLMARKAAELGVPSDIIGRMVTTPPDRMAWLTPAELEEMHVEIVEDDTNTYRPGSPLRPGQPAASVAAPTSSQLAPSPSRTRSPAYAQGKSDRAKYQAWFDAQEGDNRTGASWWEAHRSQAVQLHLTCSTLASTPSFVQGCSSAQTMLAQADRRRLVEPDYRAGWNSF